MTQGEFERYVEGVRSCDEQVPDDFFRKTLEHIAATYGKVCEQFEICTHASCDSSSAAVLTALYALEVAANIGKPANHDELPF